MQDAVQISRKISLLQGRRGKTLQTGAERLQAVIPSHVLLARTDRTMVTG